jgi:hypothetical protein
MGLLRRVGKLASRRVGANRMQTVAQAAMQGRSAYICRIDSDAHDAIVGVLRFVKVP